MDAHELLDPFERLLGDISPPARVREIEAGASPKALWEPLAESGFLDALTPESAGGAGLSLAQAAPLLQALGRHAVPVPAAETMVARALLGEAGVDAPEGPIVLATGAGPAAAPTPLALTASHALVQRGERLVLASLADETIQATGARDGLAGVVAVAADAAGPTLPAPVAGLRAVAAVVRAAAIAGAADRLLEMSVAYANARTQFGKPIGRQQAIQQQLAVMAEQVVAARLAAQIGCAGGLGTSVGAAAVAKHSASLAAVQIARIAHAVHGAIGVSEEYDLQLYTRRLYEWRLADGSEAYWAEVLGARRLAAPDRGSVDFLREHTAP